MVTIDKDFNIKLDLSTIVCTKCGSSNFKFQVTDGWGDATTRVTDATVYNTTDDYKQTVLGLDCIDCKCGYALNINLNGEEK